MEYPLVEGRARIRDLSYVFLETHSELQYLEEGIPYKEFYYHSRKRDKAIEYRILKKITETPSHGGILETSQALLGMNRYRDVLPFKDTIVQLSSGEYINANRMDGSCERSEGLFIATQGPSSCSFDNFWQMVWESDVSLIIMLCNFVENDKPKCDFYFPEEGNLSFTDFEVSVANSTEIYNNLVERHLQLRQISTDETKFISHLHAKNWPDQGVPPIDENFHAINYLVSTIKRNSDMKVIVHCSAGIGRTGILIGIYNIVTALEELVRQGNEGKVRVSVFGTIRKMREQRWGMVNNVKQYKFLYKFMEYWLTAYLIHQNNH